MSRLLFTLICWSLSSCVIADEPKADATTNAAAKAMQTFSGTWEITAVQPEGATKNARRLVFQTNGTYAAQDGDGKVLWGGTFEIDPTQSPKFWDHRSHDGKKEGRDVLGIYELEGDKLKVACVVGQWKETNWTGKIRPTEFRQTEADVIIEFQRVLPRR